VGRDEDSLDFVASIFNVYTCGWQGNGFDEAVLEGDYFDQRKQLYVLNEKSTVQDPSKSPNRDLEGV
jgi:hypothetical protein